jgi:aspartate kinase
MIIQNVAKDKGETDVTFTVPQSDLARAQAMLEERQQDIGFYRMIAEGNVAKISVVGCRHAQPRRRRGDHVQDARRPRHQHHRHLDQRDQGLGPDRHRRLTELAVRVLHTAYGLDAADEAA